MDPEKINKTLATVDKVIKSLETQKGGVSYQQEIEKTTLDVLAKVHSSAPAKFKAVYATQRKNGKSKSEANRLGLRLVFRSHPKTANKAIMELFKEVKKIKEQFLGQDSGYEEEKAHTLGGEELNLETK